jgi:hypothetical protein
MMPNFIDKVGDWNPQLMREIKGRLKFFNVAIALLISFVGQLLLFLFQFQDFPSNKYSLTAKYCNLSKSYIKQQNGIYSEIDSLRNQLSSLEVNKLANADKIIDIKAKMKALGTEQTNLSNFLGSNHCPLDQINMQMWWRDHWEYIFLTLSIVFIFILLVGGTYLLINNLVQEENRGTLNFIRLSPQSETDVLIGKMLGVPILVYLVTLTALPLHFIAGRSAQIATSYILFFYTILAASCIFFYSLALLFGLATRWLIGFQPWLGAGAMLLFLSITMQVAGHTSYYNNVAIWLRLLSPFEITEYLFPNLTNGYKVQPTLKELQFFYLPVGKTIFGLIAVNLLNYGFWNYWVWQGLKRRFRNSSTAIFSKKNSYFLVTGFQIMLWGFTLQNYAAKNCFNDGKTLWKTHCSYDLNKQIGDNFPLIVFFNLILLFGLMVILSPQRQGIQDWARYRYQHLQSLWQDMIWTEKSPAQVAIAINLLIVTIPVLTWIVIAPILNVDGLTGINWWINNIGRTKMILGLGLFLALMMIYSTIVQKMLLMKTNKRYLWAVGAISALIFLPPTMLGLLRVSPMEYPYAWAFSTFPWSVLEYGGIPTLFSALIVDGLVLAVLNFQVAKQIKLAGESATKALMSRS